MASRLDGVLGATAKDMTRPSTPEQRRSRSMLARAVKRSPQTSLVLTTLAALLSVTALLLLTVSTQAGSASASRAAKPTVVLLHGAWADASGWSHVTERLQKDGYRVLAP